MSRSANGQNALFVLDHKDAYRQIRNFLAGRFVGATRDESLLNEVTKCLFCKLHLRQRGEALSEIADSIAIAERYRQAFSELRQLLPTIFAAGEELLLDPPSLAYIDGQLEGVELDNSARDPFGDLYEAFIGTSVRGQEGQFFTPQNAIHLLVSLVSPQSGEKIRVCFI